MGTYYFHCFFNQYIKHPVAVEEMKEVYTITVCIHTYSYVTIQFKVFKNLNSNILRELIKLYNSVLKVVS